MKYSHQIEEQFEFSNQSNINQQISQKWTTILGKNYEIYISDIYKHESDRLGIALESTIDTENGEEIDTHNYIRTVLSDGIVGREGTLKPGDEILEINNQMLYGKNHVYVTEVLEFFNHQIKLICARRKIQQLNQTNPKRSRSTSFNKTNGIVHIAKSMETLHLTDNTLSRTTETRSLEVISNLALWSNSILNIELTKSDHDLGFSVHNYQDPSNSSYSSVIVIRSLVPGGVAQLDGRIRPGDHLVAVNDITFENMNLDNAIKILKSIPKGPVKLTLSKPLPYPKFKNDNDDKITDNDQDVNNNNYQPGMWRREKSGGCRRDFLRIDNVYV